MKNTFKFNETPIPPITQVGGKAHSLITMTNAGFNVPNGMVCGANFFNEWIEQVNASSEWDKLQNALKKEEPITAHTNAIAKYIKQLKWSDFQNTQISATLENLDVNSLYAVRSSSPEEDLEGSSFAGIYETVLGVRQSDIKDAILQVFLSAFDERVFIYKRAKGFATNTSKIAVVVMEQIDSETAGVGFSINPINNDYDEASINANFGLGESVVGGIVSPDYFVMNKVDGSVISKELGNKKKSVYLSADSGTHQKDNSSSDSFCITDEQAREITDMIKKVEDLYKLPMDIEWAYSHGKLYMIQGRPITTHIPLPKDMQTEPGDKKRTLYYDCSVLEGITTNKPITPMTLDWTLNDLSNTMTEPYMGEKSYSADGNPQTDIFFGKGVRLYMNFSQLFFLTSPKSIAKSFEEADKNIASALARLDIDKYKPSEKFHYLEWKTVIPFAFKALFHSHSAIWKWIEEGLHPLKFYEEKYKPCSKRIFSCLKELTDSEENLNEYRKQSTVFLTEYFEILMPLMFTYIKELTATQKMFENETPERKDLGDHLLMGIDGDESINLGISLYNLSRLLPQSEFENLDMLCEKLKKRELPKPFMQAWDAFIEKHGIRGPNEMELATPRYADDPSLALEQMNGMLQTNQSPEESLKKHVKQREEAYQKLMETLPKKDANTLQKRYEIVHELSAIRNTLKYLFVTVNHKIRTLVLRDAQQFVKEKRLELANDIFFLTFTEIEAAKNDPKSEIGSLVKKRKPDFTYATKNIKSFPVFIDSRGRIISAPVDTQNEKNTDPNILVGNGISRGIARGRVKVLRDPREKKIEKGDILVTYNTDPGWTPLFIGSEGIVLEVGAVLQHGGLVAREYAKPCVAGIKNITEKLKDGQMVEVDGTKGTVKILSSS